jgi:hypothetical protein
VKASAGARTCCIAGATALPLQQILEAYAAPQLSARWRQHLCCRHARFSATNLAACEQLSLGTLTRHHWLGCHCIRQSLSLRQATGCTRRGCGCWAAAPRRSPWWSSPSRAWATTSSRCPLRWGQLLRCLRLVTGLPHCMSPAGRRSDSRTSARQPAQIHSRVGRLPSCGAARASSGDTSAPNWHRYVWQRGMSSSRWCTCRTTTWSSTRC